MATTDQVLQQAQDMLDTAKLGLADLQSTERSRRMSGLRNVIVFGRSVTFALQNLKSTEANFEEWYSPIRDGLSKNSLMRYFIDLRNEILHQGKLEVSTLVHIKSFMAADLAKLPKPRGAVAFFMGDEIGGSGWEINVGQGKTENYYIDLPGELAEVKQVFSNISHKYADLENSRIEDLAETYVTEMQAIVEQAKIKFGQQPPKAAASHLRLVK